MIVTLTLNPAVDISLTVDRLVPEHRLHCSQPYRDAGGGGINISKAIQRVGGQSLAVFTSGGATGLMLQELVETAGISFQIIGIAEPIRESFAITETTTNQQFRLCTPGPTLSRDEAAACLARLETLSVPIDYLVISGSLPPGLPADFYAQIARIANRKQFRLILDTAGEPLRAALDEGVFMIKPNLGELAELVGVDKLETEQIGEVALQLIRQNKCEVVVVSLGSRGAMLITANEQDYVHAPPVQQVSTAYTGDSLVGGMVHALSRRQSYADMIRMGVACGTAATMTNTELFNATDVDPLVEWLNHQRQSQPA